MTYNRKTWGNYAAGGTPVDATGLVDFEGRVETEFGLQTVARQWGGELVAYNTSRSAGRVPELLNGGPANTLDRFPSKLAGMLGLRERMLATAGATVCWDEATGGITGENSDGESGGGWVTILHDDRRPRPGSTTQNYGYLSPTACWTSADWVNDIARVNDGYTNGTGTRQNARTTAILKHGMRFVYSRACAAMEWRPDDTSGTAPLVYSGTTSTPTAVSYSTTRERAYRGAVSGPGGYRSMPSGAIVTIPLPADYPGSALAPLAVCFGGVTAITAGSITVSGITGGGATGNSKTLSLANTNSTTGVADPYHVNPLVLRFTGTDIPAGAQSVALTAASPTGANARFLGAWIESPEPPTGIAFNTAHMNGSLFFTWATDADYTYQNARQAEVVAEFARSGQPDHVLLGDIDAVIGGTRAGDSSKAIYFSDTMHGEATQAAEYAIIGYSLLTGHATSSVVRAKARRSRTTTPDMIFDGTIGADTSIANNGAVLSLTVENRDHSGLHSGNDNPSRVRLFAVGRWSVTFSTGWLNSQGTTALTSGTVAKTNGSKTVTGTSTVFLADFTVGQRIRVPGTSNEDKTVKQIASDTSLLVDTAFSNAASGQTGLNLGPTGTRGIGYQWTQADGTVATRTIQLAPMSAQFNSIFPMLQSYTVVLVTTTPNDYVEPYAFHNAGTGLTDSLHAASTRFVVQYLGPS